MKEIIRKILKKDHLRYIIMYIVQKPKDGTYHDYLTGIVLQSVYLLTLGILYPDVRKPPPDRPCCIRFEKNCKNIKGCTAI